MINLGNDIRPWYLISFLFRSYQRQEVNTLRKASERLEDEVAKLKKKLANEKFER